MGGGRCVELVLGAVAQGMAELMVASHNQASVQKAARCMHRFGLHPSTSGDAPGSWAVIPCPLIFPITPGRSGVLWSEPLFPGSIPFSSNNSCKGIVAMEAD